MPIISISITMDELTNSIFNSEIVVHVRQSEWTFRFRENAIIFSLCCWTYCMREKSFLSKNVCRQSVG